MPANFIFLPIQVVLFIFLLFAFSRVVLRYKDNTIPLGTFLFWVGLWAFASFGIIEPEFTTYLAKKIGIGRGVDAVVYASIILLFYLIFRLSVAIENLRHEITKIVRQVALKDKNDSKKK